MKLNLNTFAHVRVSLVPVQMLDWSVSSPRFPPSTARMLCSQLEEGGVVLTVSSTKISPLDCYWKTGLPVFC